MFYFINPHVSLIVPKYDSIVPYTKSFKSCMLAPFNIFMSKFPKGFLAYPSTVFIIISALFLSPLYILANCFDALPEYFISNILYKSKKANREGHSFSGDTLSLNCSLMKFYDTAYSFSLSKGSRPCSNKNYSVYLIAIATKPYPRPADIPNPEPKAEKELLLPKTTPEVIPYMGIIE